MIQDRSAGDRTSTKSGNCTPRVSRVAALAWLCLLGIGPILGGCASSASYEEQHYILETARPGAPAGSAVAGSLAVHRFSVDSAFAARNLVYRLGEFKYETDPYRQFLIAPGVMITERTRDWLADSGIFARVLATSSRIVPAYILEGNVTTLYGDFAGKSASAVMEIRFFLLENTETENVVFSETYRATTPVPEKTTEVFIEALNASLADILTRFEADLQKALAAQSNAAGTPGN